MKSSLVFESCGKGKKLLDASLNAINTTEDKMKLTYPGFE
jgi:hypothetical protein